MILLEITDESGISHYETLEITPQELGGLDEQEASKKVRKAANKAKASCNKKARKGDKAAEEQEIRINDALKALLKKEDRDKYDKELQSGKEGALLEVLRIQPLAPPFWVDRIVRLRTIERLMQEAGCTRPLELYESEAWC